MQDEVDDAVKSPVGSESGPEDKILTVEYNTDMSGHDLFPPHKGTNIDFYKTRTVQLTRTIDGEKVPGFIKIKPAEGDRGYHSKTYDVFLGLVRVWQSQGKPDGLVSTTASSILVAMGHQPNGVYYDMVFEELSVMQTTSVQWGSAYKMKFDTGFLDEETGEVILKDGVSEVLEGWSLLASLKWAKTGEKDRGKNIKPGHKIQFQFPQEIINNFLNKVTVPANISARLRLKSSIARVVYSRIDNLLTASKNGVIEQKAKTLIDAHHLDPKKYVHKSRRQKLVEDMHKYIDGSASSKPGSVIRTSVQETSAGDDYKITFRLESVKLVDDMGPGLLVINEADMQEALSLFISQKIGYSKENRAYYRKLAKYYTVDHIKLAIEDTLAATGGNEETNLGKLFSYFMHKRTHELGLEWIKKCGENCPLMPGASLF